MARYVKEFAVMGRAPYLGMPPGMVWDVRDVAELPADVESIALTPKSQNVKKLADFKSLRRIDCPFRADWLPVLASIGSLRFLKVRLPRTAEIPSLMPLTQLRTLVLCCNRHQQDLEFVRGMTWLHSLCVSEAVEVASLDPLATLAGLREIYIDGKIGRHHQVDSLRPLSPLEELRYAVLLLRVVKLHRTLQPLLTLKRLEFLHLTPDYTPQDYDALLSGLPRLDEIRFNAGRRWPPAGNDES